MSKDTSESALELGDQGTANTRGNDPGGQPFLNQVTDEFVESFFKHQKASEYLERFDQSVKDRRFQKLDAQQKELAARVEKLGVPHGKVIDFALEQARQQEQPSMLPEGEGLGQGNILGIINPLKIVKITTMDSRCDILWTK